MNRNRIVFMYREKSYDSVGSKEICCIWGCIQNIFINDRVFIYEVYEVKILGKVVRVEGLVYRKVQQFRIIWYC